MLLFVDNSQQPCGQSREKHQRCGRRFRLVGVFCEYATVRTQKAAMMRKRPQKTPTSRKLNWKPGSKFGRLRFVQYRHTLCASVSVSNCNFRFLGKNLACARRHDVLLVHFGPIAGPGFEPGRLSNFAYMTGSEAWPPHAVRTVRRANRKARTKKTNRADIRRVDRSRPWRPAHQAQ